MGRLLRQSSLVATGQFNCRDRPTSLSSDKRVSVRQTLDGNIEIRDLTGRAVANHCVAPDGERFVTVAEHHACLWDQVRVEARDLGYYTEVL